MVIERVVTQYVCEFCQMAFTTREDAEDCESRCRRFVDSPGLKILNLSPRAFNVLYGAKIETVGELLLLSEKELSEIRRLVPASQHEVKAKLTQYSVL